MKIVLAGGTGQVGTLLTRQFHASGHDCIVLSRNPSQAVCSLGKPATLRTVLWDGVSLGAWVDELEGADAVINLAGRSVNCRYHERNLREMTASRIDSTRVIGQALTRLRRPPPVWLQASTATIYAHRYDTPNDEVNGIIGGEEPSVPLLWRRSVEIALAWEKALFSSDAPQVRKVALRSSMIMSPDAGGVFDVLCTLANRGLGGAQGRGDQYVSWIHEADFVQAIYFLLRRTELSGVVNLCSPKPLPNCDFLAHLRKALGVRIAPPQPRWLLEMGAFFMRTETELLLKSRRVVPGRLLAEGFSFRYPEWAKAAAGLAARWKAGRRIRRL